VTRIQLTDREGEVLRLAISGLSNDEIAARLVISRRTVEAHLRTLFRKTGVTKRTQLAALCQADDGRVELSGPEALDAAAVSAVARPSQPHDPADCERQLRDCAKAFRGLVDRQYPLLEERVEITLTIGEQDGQDIVVERRWSRPRPYIAYRITGPILNWSDGPPLSLDDLGLGCSVDGQDTHVDTYLVWDVNGRPLVMILFQPGLQVETEWVLRYRSPELWSPLRSSGEDFLTWATTTLDQRHKPTISALTLKVIFPASWTQERLTEQNNLGTVHTERLPTGQSQLTWHHDTPHAGTYHWFLQGSPSERVG
jgi:DNA-binding CsgD family transcriptional regulator